jgi:CheY-like chemotaxis protein
MDVTTPRGRPRVLVVDDDVDQRALLSTALTDEGFEVLEAGNGQQAIDLLLHGDEPQVILLDLVMPVSSGWDVLSVVRTYIRLRRIPVIIVTGHPATVQVPRANVVARLQKPYRLPDLLDVMNRFIGSGSGP